LIIDYVVGKDKGCIELKDNCQENFIFAGVSDISGDHNFEQALNSGRLGLGLPTRSQRNVKTFIN